jgi:hypothetical protein
VSKIDGEKTKKILQPSVNMESRLVDWKIASHKDIRYPFGIKQGCFIRAISPPLLVFLPESCRQ